MRYFLFAGDAYYPNGGVGDIVGAFNDLEYAKQHAEKPRKKYSWSDITEPYDWANILDTETHHTYVRRGPGPGAFQWEERDRIGV